MMKMETDKIMDETNSNAQAVSLSFSGKVNKLSSYVLRRVSVCSI